jgi:proprotein convertase subtilisin/kexin type 1
MNNGGWRINGAGLLVNSKFGFGLMNAFEIVKAAQTWTEVPQQRICTTRFPGFRKRMVSSRLSTAVEFETNACEGTRNEIKYVEHVQLIADIDATSRGHLAIWLESPQGTRSQLLSPRERDKSRAGFRHWPFMTVHHWGENPAGLWRLHVHDFNDRGAHSTPSGYINNISLVMYGTREQPVHYATGRTYEGIDLDVVGLSQNNTAELMDTVSAVPFESLSVEQNNHLLQEDGEADRTLDRVVRNLRRLQDTNWWRTKNNGNIKSPASE